MGVGLVRQEYVVDLTQGSRPVWAGVPFAAAISPGISFAVQIAVIIAIFYLLLIRPQAKRQKEHQRMLGELQKGDRILTTGGLYASVLNVKDNIVVANLAENVKVEIAKSAVAARVEPVVKK